MKLIGYIDGVEVKFDFNPPNQFKAIIPKHLDGMYIVELHVIDDAGNQTNATELLVAIDFDKLTFKILEKDYTNKEDNKEFEFRKLPQKYTFKELV